MLVALLAPSRLLPLPLNDYCALAGWQMGACKHPGCTKGGQSKYGGPILLCGQHAPECEHPDCKTKMQKTSIPYCYNHRTPELRAAPSPRRSAAVRMAAQQSARAATVAAARMSTPASEAGSSSTSADSPPTLPLVLPMPPTMLSLPVVADGHGATPSSAASLMQRILSQPIPLFDGLSGEQVAMGGQHVFRLCATCNDPWGESCASFCEIAKAGGLLPMAYFSQHGGVQPTLSQPQCNRYLKIAPLLTLSAGDMLESDALERAGQEHLRPLAVSLALMAAGRQTFHTGRGGRPTDGENDAMGAIARAALAGRTDVPAAVQTLAPLMLPAGASELLRRAPLLVTSSRLSSGGGKPATYCSQVKKGSPLDEAIKRLRQDSRRFQPGTTISLAIISLDDLRACGIRFRSAAGGAPFDAPTPSATGGPDAALAPSAAAADDPDATDEDEPYIPALHGEYPGLLGVLPDGTAVLDFSGMPSPFELVFGASHGGMP